MENNNYGDNMLLFTIKKHILDTEISIRIGS